MPIEINLIEHKDQADPKLLQDWMEGPVVLASTSGYRREQLLRMGFKADKLTAISGIDSDEVDDLSTYEHGFTGSHFYPFRTEGNKVIAGGKLKRAVESGKVPTGALGIAVDTGILHFDEDIEKHRENVWQAETLMKPKDLADAKEKLLAVFQGIINCYKDTQEMIAEAKVVSAPRGEEVVSRAINMMKLGDKGIQLMVTNGVAVKFPGQNKIELFEEELVLIPEKLFEAGIENDLEELVDNILALNPDLVTKVPAGLPLHDKRVRNLLGIRIARNARFLDEAEMNDGSFKGMPSEVILDFLRKRAVEIGRDLVAFREEIEQLKVVRKSDATLALIEDSALDIGSLEVWEDYKQLLRDLRVVLSEGAVAIDPHMLADRFDEVDILTKKINSRKNDAFRAWMKNRIGLKAFLEPLTDENFSVQERDEVIADFEAEVKDFIG